MKLSELQKDHEWIGAGSIAGLLVWPLLNYPKSTWAAVTAASGYLIYFHSPRPDMVIAAPFYIVVYAFLAIAMTLSGLIADSIAEWLMRKIVSTPDKTNTVHQVVFFVLAMLSILPALLFITAGGFPE